MKLTIKGVAYETEKDKCLAEKTDGCGTSWCLKQTRGGKFYIHECRYYVGGKPKPYGMQLDTFSPGCLIEKPSPHFRNDVERRDFIRPVSRTKALAWCIRTQMPRTFRKELTHLI